MSITVAKVKSIRIKLHYTFVIIFVLVTWSLSSTSYSDINTRIRLCDLLVHRCCRGCRIIHFRNTTQLTTIMAIRYGIKVRQIVLFIFGGVSDIEEEPKELHKEFKIAVVGPLTSFGLAGIFSLFSFFIENIIGSGTSTTLQAIDVVLSYGAFINIMLGAFNLIPAFPLDGGRILRAILVKRNRDYDAATRSVVKISVMISYALMGIGFFTIITRNFVGGLWILLIGWFLNTGAQSYMQQRELGSILSSVTIGQIINRNMITVGKGTNLNDVFTKYFGLFMKTAFPVTDDSASILGLITVNIAKVIPEPKRQYTLVEDIMIPRNE